MQTIRITTTQNIDIDYEVAGLGERIVAYIIDMAMFFVILIGTLIAISAAGGFEKGGNGGYAGLGIMLIIYAVLFVFYDLICEVAMNGQSVGKKVMKIKVISLDGTRPRLGQYLLRWLFRIVDFTLTSDLCALICIAVSDKSQRVGDMVAGTTLIRTVPRTKMQNIAFKPEADTYQPVFPQAASLSEQDVELINEVINNYIKSGNSMLVYSMAQRIKDLLNVMPPAEMNNMLFLQTIIKDYSHIVAQADVL
ncbi:RDD family protein [Mucilaginibacter sp. HC2]|uniref:RDD family protein n=1 Tax=Mucilaginibacter inviolabilis TaxID=2714892 RepID=UPI001407AC1D|nr:RDD family protein [Mucilaginibacter inviolabilis]NHA06061.1 RDD family protein [Mucilaginibacter inviolabilis]